MSINNCVFMGNLGQDPSIAYLPDGRAVTNLSIACTKKWKDKNSGEIKEKTEWVRAVVFGKRAEVISEHFKKGSQIHITGEMCTRSYEREGVKHWTTEIVISDFQFCGQRSDGNSEKSAQQANSYSQGDANKKKQGGYQGGNKNTPPVADNYGSDFDDDIPFDSLNSQIRQHLV